MYALIPHNKRAAVIAGEPIHLRVDFRIPEARQFHAGILYHKHEVWLIVLPTDEPALALPREVYEYEDLADLRYVYTGSIERQSRSSTFRLGVTGTNAIRDRLCLDGISDSLIDTMIAPRRAPGGQFGPLLYWRIHP